MFLRRDRRARAPMRATTTNPIIAERRRRTPDGVSG
jgi:hypothetical protein